jgi:hypothetical protein
MAPPFLTSALDRGEWSALRALRTCRSTPTEGAPAALCIGALWGGGGGRVGLDCLDMVKGKICYACRKSNPDSSNAIPYPSRYTD